jgi:predicted nucleic acid-binding protein
MPSIITFLDANILITGCNTTDLAIAIRIAQIINDPQRAFVTNDFLELEVLPKPVHNKQAPSVMFYRNYFAACAYRIPTAPQLLADAFREACQLGLSAPDAIHLATAHAAGAHEFITMEKLTKPMYQTSLVKVFHLSQV